MLFKANTFLMFSLPTYDYLLPGGVMVNGGLVDLKTFCGVCEIWGGKSLGFSLFLRNMGWMVCRHF